MTSDRWDPREVARPVDEDETLPAGLEASTVRELANDLLEAHLLGDITIESWSSAREVVEAYYGPLELAEQEDQ